MPDLFHGDPVKLNPGLKPKPGFDLNTWMGNHQPDTIDPVVSEVLAAMKQDYGVQKIGAVGYCFGARVRGCSPL
jgi:dienelactone hydrolase